jgi:alkaline phosphatase D
VKKTLSLFLLLFAIQFAQAQENLLQSGPMVGYSSMKEVLLWVQTKQSAKVHFVYYPTDKPNEKMQTETVETQAKNAFVARIVAQVKHTTKYSYELYINGKQVKRPYPLTFQSQTHWQYRTEPPTVRFLFGSCLYVNEPEVDRPGNPYGGDFEILKAMADKKADFMVWGGDNTYLREVDFDSRTGIMQRYTHTRSLPELQPLLGNMHHYATWDDHDYGPNDSDETYNMKKETLEAFKLFWGNQMYAFDESVAGNFNWADVEFFFLDDRWFRTPIGIKTVENQMFGEKQIRWLIESLKSSKATFKLVVAGGQILNTDASLFSEAHVRYREEHEKLLRMLQDERVSGVVFLTGDRHHSEVSKMERPGSYPLYEFTVSPLTAGSSGDRAKDEKNLVRVPDTYYGKRNFGVFEVTGTRKERVLTVQLCDVQGNVVWKQEIKASDLK